MILDNKKEKARIRQELTEKRARLSSGEVLGKSMLIKKRLEQLEEYRKAGAVLLYASFRNEVSTRQIIADALKSKKVVLPKMRKDICELELYEIKRMEDLEENRLGIPEPKEGLARIRPEEIEAAVVPAAGFDSRGNRLGSGKGYYDRLLQRMSCRKITLGFDIQEADHIESEAHDVPVDIIVTESRTIKAEPRARIIDGKMIADSIIKGIRDDVSGMKEKPCLAVVLVGEDAASKVYVGIKKKRCEETGIASRLYDLPADTPENDLVRLIETLNKDAGVTGILVQLPLPKHIDEERVVNSILPDKDVDGLTFANLQGLLSGKQAIEPCTPKGVMRLIESSGITVEGSNAVVVGRSNIVGKPAAMMLLKKDATVTICHSRTKDLSEITKKADILVIAVGRKGLIRGEMVKEGAVVIDVGINREGGRLYGDVDFESVKNKCSYITPVPGGVGPMTVAMLMENTLACYKMQNKQR